MLSSLVCRAVVEQLGDSWSAGRSASVAACWDSVLLERAAAIAEFALKRRIPTLAPLREYVEEGFLLSLGASRIPGRVAQRLLGFLEIRAGSNDRKWPIGDLANRPEGDIASRSRLAVSGARF